MLAHVVRWFTFGTVVLVRKDEAEALATAVVLLRVACIMPDENLESLRRLSERANG